MTVAAPQTDASFTFPGVEYATGTAGPPATAVAPAALDFGPLSLLEGVWCGKGFNTIWRPHFPSVPQAEFLELNMTTETLAFTKIGGAIPNRGLLNHDINMVGLTYMQQIAQTEDEAALHIEPGIWALVPATDDPNVDQTVVRMASIPHGTAILAQGTAFTVASGPRIEDNNIIPFCIGSMPPQNSGFDKAAAGDFEELDLSKKSVDNRFVSPGVTQDMVKNPNLVLKEAIKGQTITSTTVLIVSTTHDSTPGGGTANTAFLEEGTRPPGCPPGVSFGNANAALVDATFWIETVAGEGGEPDHLQLQYTQLVQLDFHGLRWPHVTVATLTKQ
ncbi:MAG: FABP family protein [Actinomycetota bacterium]|nr:FABP family protein [Actinomycetota bacterium]